MSERTVAAAERALARERERLAAGRWPAAEARLVFLEEIAGSCALAGVALDAAEVAALVLRGTVPAGRRLEACVLAADYAAAAELVRDAAPRGSGRRVVRIEEIVALHRLALRRSLGDAPGTWRALPAQASPGGAIPPPPWLVAREMAIFAARAAKGPAEGESPLRWVAREHERFARIRPFATGNGRVGRLLANLLLRRLGYAPLVLARPAAARAWLGARARAGAGDVEPLVAALARGVLATTRRLATASELAGDGAAGIAATGGLVPLRDAPSAAGAVPSTYEARYKAAVRGGLRTVRRGGRLYTTAAWLAAYEAGRRDAAAG